MGIIMDDDQNSVSSSIGLSDLLRGFTVFNLVTLTVEKFISNNISTKNHVVSQSSPVVTRDEITNQLQERHNSLHSREDTSKHSFHITDLTGGDFRFRLKQTSQEYQKNNSFMDWNEWAQTNPLEARNICLEADYFYGNSNILPVDWSSIVEKWGKAGSRGDATLDDN